MVPSLDETSRSWSNGALEQD